MTAKVVTRSSEENFFLWCDAIKYNPDVLVGEGEDGERWFGIRMRPWKQDKRAPVMHVGYGHTLVEAMRTAIAEYQGGEELPLDYAYRPWTTSPAAIPAPSF